MIRHAGLNSPKPIGPLPVTMIESPFGALLVTAVGLAPLLASGFETTTLRTVPLATVAALADPERRTALRSGATSLMEKKLPALCHPASKAGLDRTSRSWQVDSHVGTWRSLTGPTHKPRSL